MALTPVVRYMILCDDWGIDPDNPHRVNIFGLLSHIRSIDQPPYPLWYREFCVFLALTEGRGSADGQIVCVFEETSERIFETPRRQIAFGPDPLEIVGVPFRILDCRFPRAGLYLVQFWYNDEKLVERPLCLR